MNALKGVPKEYRKPVRQALRQGWRPKTRGNGNHLKLLSPDGVTMVVISCSPNGGCRSLENTLAELRRGGATV